MVIEGPKEGHKNSGVVDIESYRKIHHAIMREHEKSTREISTARKAYVNHGRWVVNCECNGAGLTSPSFKVSCCFDCGNVYTNIVFPNQVEKIEETLLKRYNQTTRNWQGESLSELLEENKAHEVNDGMDGS